MTDKMGTAQHAVGVSQALSPNFPPGFMDSVPLFSATMFGCLFLTCLSVATVLRYRRLNIQQRLRFDHPTAILRRKDAMKEWAIFSLSAPTALKCLLWGQVSSAIMSANLFAINAGCVIALLFALAATVHGSMTDLIRWFYGTPGGAMILAGRGMTLEEMLHGLDDGTGPFHDFRKEWPSPIVAYKIMITCAALTLVFTVLRVLGIS